MHWLPLVASFALALLIAPGTVALLERAGVVAKNYRGLTMPTAAGILIAAAGLFALAPLAVLDELADADTLRGGTGRVLVFALGVATLGLVDDLLGGRPPAAAIEREAPRGLRGHGRAAAAGQLSTGLLKALGTAGLALYVMSGTGRSPAEYLLGAAVLALSTHVFNLLDLRPGRAGKTFLALGLALTVASWDVAPFQVLGLFLGPALVLLPFDLRERAMLGDVGSNLLGGLAGIWLLLSLTVTGEAVALAVLAVITVYGEVRSISALVEKSPLLRRIDSIGRQRSPL